MRKPKSKRVLLVVQNPVMRQGLALLLAERGFETDDARRSKSYDAIVVDTVRSDRAGLSVVDDVMGEQMADERIVVLTGTRDGHDQALKLGADCAVHRDAPIDEIVAAIDGVTYTKQRLDEVFGRRSLTTREASVVRSIAHGLSNEETGKALEISARTVEVHRANAMRKLGLDNRSELVRYAVRSGMVSL